MSLNLDPLDQFEIALRRGTANPEDLFELGFVPALEFSALRYSRWRGDGEDLLTTFPQLIGWPALRNLRSLGNSLALLAMETPGRSLPFIREDARLGVQEFGASAEEWSPDGKFSHFLTIFHMALRKVGIRLPFASALAGALEEMASNAAEHANAPVPPVAAFEVGPRSWTFGVVDMGRGVLASLRENPDFTDLTSETTALASALRPGVSRYKNAGRGNGFSVLFKALVDQRASLQFRSGGASASWHGESPTHQSITARALPLSRRGFQIRVAGSVPAS